MNDANHILILDLHHPQIPFSIHAKKGDTAKILKVKLTDNGEPYTIGNDCYAVFSAKKPDGNIIFNACEIADNVISYRFTPQTCAVPGEVPCEVRLYGANDKLITSPGFLLTVEDTVYTDGDVYESSTEADRAAAEAQRVAAEQLRQAAEARRVSDTEGVVARVAKEADDAEYWANRAEFIASGNVNSFNGRKGLVVPQSGDYTAAMVGAAPAVESAAYPGCYYREVNGVVEWLNPPMQLGVEYRTTERYDGKPVYVLCVNLGDIPADGAVEIPVTYSAAGPQIIRFAGIFGVHALPLRSYDVWLDVQRSSFDKIMVTMHCGTEVLVGGDVSVQIWYLK